MLEDFLKPVNPLVPARHKPEAGADPLGVAAVNISAKLSGNGVTDAGFADARRPAGNHSEAASLLELGL
jgi:hypothetical protein